MDRMLIDIITSYRKAIESKRKELEEKEKKLIEFDRQLQKRKEQMDQLEKSLQKVQFNTLLADTIRRKKRSNIYMPMVFDVF